MTDAEHEDADLKNQIYREGLRTGRQWGADEAQLLRDRIDQLERKANKWKTRAKLRHEDHLGRQLVTVDEKLGYAWAGSEPLAVGDKVRLPGNWVRPDGWVGEVTALGSTWEGDFVSILGRV